MSKKQLHPFFTFLLLTSKINEKLILECYCFIFHYKNINNQK